MRKKVASQPSFAAKGSLASVRKPRISSVFLLLSLCYFTPAVFASLEAKQQRSSGSRDLFKGEDESTVSRSVYHNGDGKQEIAPELKGDVDSISNNNGAKMVDHGALQPLDDYINAKRKLSVEGQITSTYDDDERKNFKSRSFKLSEHKGGNFRENGEYNRPFNEQFISEKYEEFPESDWVHKTKKIPFVSKGDKALKRAKENKHGSSIKETEVRERNQKLLSDDAAIPGRGIVDRHDHQRTKQRKTSRKRERLAPRSKKGNVPLEKSEGIEFQSQGGISSKGIISKIIRQKKIPSNSPSTQDSVLEQNIDPSGHTSPDSRKEDAFLEADTSSQADSVPIPSVVPSSSSQWQMSQTSSLSPPVQSGNAYHDALQVSWKDKKGPKGATSLTKDRERILWPVNPRENRGRRHLDGKEEGRDRRLEDGEEENRDNNKTPQDGHETEGFAMNSNDDHSLGSKQEVSVRNPPVWGTLGNHPDADERDRHYPAGENLNGWHSNREDTRTYSEILEHEEDPRTIGDDFGNPPMWSGGNPMVSFDDYAHQHNVISGANSESWCGCWDTDAVQKEVECSCQGPDFKQIPANLSAEVFRITVMDAGLDTLRNDSFTRYRKTLRDIVLQNVNEFHTIEAGAFRGLRQLRSIYIHFAPMLKMMPNLTFTEDNTKLKSLRIVSSGLEQVPNMQFTGPTEIFHMIELDSNRIQKIHSRSLQVRVEELSLNYNHIQIVEREAFSGSDIGKLSLKGNQKLTYLHPEAFEGIGSLRTLDLSETSITSLPTSGLIELEVLRLENTPTLKVFPSVYSFKTIKKAYLTYPYHCCAFQFPEQHDREQYISHKKIIELEQEHCSEVTSPSSPVMAPTTRVRRRRETTLSLTASSAEGFRPSRTSATSVTAQGPLTELQMNHRPRLDSVTEDEKWGNVRSGTSGEADVIMLSSVKTNHNDQIKRRHTRTSAEVNQQFDNEVSSVMTSEESSEFVKRKSTLKRSTRNIKGILINDAVTHSKTRHYVHRGRRSRPKMNATNSEQSDSKSIFREGLSGDHPAPPRRLAKPRYEPIRAPQLSESQSLGENKVLAGSKGNHDAYGMYDADDFIPIPDKRLETMPDRNAGTRPLPNETFEPMPDKRFGVEEMPQHMGGPLEEDFLGVGGVGGAGGFPNFLGFGSFNHTSDRYPDRDTVKFNDTSHVGALGGSQNRPIGPGSGIEHDDDVPIIYPGGFLENEGFADIENIQDGHPVVEEKQDGRQQNGNWHPTRAPMNNTTILIMCGNLSKNYHDVECSPAPDAFNPCEDIMGNLALRVAVWFVVVTAVLGNLAVMLVLVSSKFRMTVSKFLMVNLALADLCMGIYLLIIASMDLHTIGVYFNHAIDWQNGPGCKVAGFLTVFASELSIFTLTVITSERWYAITYAIHLNKRLKLSMAAKIMVVGWIYSITMATLPLVGISGYSKTSICLPMETGDALALAYLTSLLLVNGLAFFVITACYASMYCSISRHDASASHSDLTVAKRMALLVFTDFACWAPIAFFGLTAVAGIPLINVTRAKILLVFFYPLNSCANPYLYAILTKQYRRDLFILLARYGFCTKRAMRYKGAYSSVNNTFPHNTVVNAPNHRNSTLTQITLCDLTRTARTSQQSNNGSLLGTMIGGSQDSLQRSISPSRTPTKPETSCGDTERLSTVQEMSHSNHSDDENNSDHGHQRDDAYGQEAATGVVKQAGSPHPIKNCYTRLSFTPEQEQILKHALNESKAKMKLKSEEEKENGRSVVEENGKKVVTESGKGNQQDLSTCGEGEAIMMRDVEVSNVEQESSVVNNKSFDEIEEATSTV